MSLRVTGIIPARLGSTRFPNKVLYPFRGRPLLYYVWRDIQRSKRIDRLLVATDSPEVRQAAEDFGAEVIMTHGRCRTGTDRVAVAAEQVGGDIIVNIQADNFGVMGSLVDRVLMAMAKDRHIGAATLASPVRSDKELFDPGLVKVVADNEGNAAWFSRFPIPYLQRPSRGARARQHRFLGHIGIYFYRRGLLKRFAKMRKTPAEEAESLEQLRLIENGLAIRLFQTKSRVVSVDTPKDLRKLSAIYK